MQDDGYLKTKQNNFRGVTGQRESPTGDSSNFAICKCIKVTTVYIFLNVIKKQH